MPRLLRGLRSQWLEAVVTSKASQPSWPAGTDCTSRSTRSGSLQKGTILIIIGGFFCYVGVCTCIHTHSSLYPTAQDDTVKTDFFFLFTHCAQILGSSYHYSWVMPQALHIWIWGKYSPLWSSHSVGWGEEDRFSGADLQIHAHLYFQYPFPQIALFASG